MPTNQIPLALCAGLVPIKTQHHNKQMIVAAGKVISHDIIERHKDIADTFIISLRHSQDIEQTVERNKKIQEHKQQTLRLENMAQQYEEGTILFEAGDESKELYVLASGEVEVLVNDTVVANISESGTYIGEMALLRNEPRSAALRTKSDCSLFVIPETTFPTILKNSPEVGTKLAKIIAQRLASTNTQLQDTQDALARMEAEKTAVEESLKEKNADIDKYKGAAISLFKRCSGEYNSTLALIEALATKFEDPHLKSTLTDVATYMKHISKMPAKGGPGKISPSHLPDALKESIRKAR